MIYWQYNGTYVIYSIMKLCLFLQLVHKNVDSPRGVYLCSLYYEDNFLEIFPKTVYWYYPDDPYEINIVKPNDKTL